MDRVVVNIGDKTYNCLVAKSEEEKKKGLQDIDYLAPDEGMLFEYSEELDIVEFWMKNTKIPLDLIVINEDDEVVLVYHAKPEDETLIPFVNVKYLLEVNLGSGITEGDEFEIDDSDDLNKYVMKVLTPSGETLFFLLGGERICSRRETKILIKKAKRAAEVKNDPEKYEAKCKSLGKYMFKVLYGLDHRAPEYVKVPDNESN